MKNKNKKLIIFDMDGTLIDSGDVIANTINFVRVNIGLDVIEKNEMLKTLNNPDINSAEYFYGTSVFTDEQTKLFTTYYDENCIKDIKLYEGIEQLLEELHGQYKLSIATNASVEFAIKMVKHLDIYNYFDEIIGANCVENPKPKPDMIHKSMKKLNAKEIDTILVGDSLKDKQAATNANIDCILVNWGFSDHCETASVSSIDELKNRLTYLLNSNP